MLEIGCGWGSFALVAAGEYGARVTGITLSPPRPTWRGAASPRPGGRPRRRPRPGLPRGRRGVHEGSLDRDARGDRREAFDFFFATIDRVLAPGGRACVQTILIPDARYRRYRSSPDWIERYVFPGCLIPSLGALAQAAGELHLHHLEEIGQHYGETLARWREAFSSPPRRGARAGLRRALRAHLGLLPRLVRGALPCRPRFAMSSSW